jgi:hypothetical protein
VAALERGLLATELVAAALGGGLFGAGGLDLEVQLGDLDFEAFEALGDAAEADGDLATLDAEGFELGAGDLGFSEQALGFELEGGKRGGGLGLFVAAGGDALHQVHGGAAIVLGLVLGCVDGADGLLRALLLGVGGVARGRSLGGCVLEEAALLFEFACEGLEVLAGLVEVRG